MAWWGANNIGSNLNEWQYPVNEFSWGDGNLESKLKSLEYVGEFNFSHQVWNNATALVDEVLKKLLVEINIHASRFEGLVFDRYIKQGSAREGLKIRAADEFDVLLEYHIEGLRMQPESISDSRGPIPGLGKMKILNPDYEVENRYATWLRKKIISVNRGSYFLNSRILHEAVFESLLDKCRENITGSDRQRISFAILRSMNPPSVNLTIKITQKTGGLFFGVTDIPDVIDIDVVPAMILKMEEAKGTSGFIECPRYAVVKWMEESQARASQFEDPAMIWRLCTSGYEKHYMDLARNDKDKRYIMTACRIIKTFMSKEKEKSRMNQLPLPISTFLRSFYLKNIAFYCMLFIKPVSGVQEALGHFLGFLNASLEKGNLPQFFHGNNFLKDDFPSCAQGGRFNLFEHASPDTLINVRRSFGYVLSRLSGMYDSRAFESDACARFRDYLNR
ncbi:hypothetical protein CHS0354_024361 [Potamilus streckersoni]|uniref:Uncharacterized protein n=1 Tax=Potamilus streckersoni TaxID=2493646 RepID=A0AAE0SVQ0_9BIVA|nr:hypothetical protein CHS0354_024361 [Potamilus streckersoni]